VAAFYGAGTRVRAASGGLRRRLERFEGRNDHRMELLANWKGSAEQPHPSLVNRSPGGDRIEAISDAFRRFKNCRFGPIPRFFLESTRCMHQRCVGSEPHIPHTQKITCEHLPGMACQIFHHAKLESGCCDLISANAQFHAQLSITISAADSSAKSLEWLVRFNPVVF